MNISDVFNNLMAEFNQLADTFIESHKTQLINEEQRRQHKKSRQEIEIDTTPRSTRSSFENKVLSCLSHLTEEVNNLKKDKNTDNSENLNTTNHHVSNKINNNNSISALFKSALTTNGQLKPNKTTKKTPMVTPAQPNVRKDIHGLEARATLAKKKINSEMTVKITVNNNNKPKLTKSSITLTKIRLYYSNTVAKSLYPAERTL